MGVTGLMSWLRSCSGTLANTTNLTGRAVLVDGSALSFALLVPGGVGDLLSDSGISGGPDFVPKRPRAVAGAGEVGSLATQVCTAAGIEYGMLASRAAAFSRMLQSCGVRAVYVMDGAPGRRKARTHLRRAAQAGAAAGVSSHHLARVPASVHAARRCHTGTCGSRPAMIDDVVAAAVAATGSTVHRAAFEADDVILRLCNEAASSEDPGAAFAAVLSNDSDFVVAAGCPGLAPLDLLSCRPLSGSAASGGALPEKDPAGTAAGLRPATSQSVECFCSVFTRDRLAAVLRVPPRALPALAGLAGNDAMDEGDLVHGAVLEAAGKPASGWPAAVSAWRAGNAAASLPLGCGAASATTPPGKDGAGAGGGAAGAAGAGGAGGRAGAGALGAKRRRAGGSTDLRGGRFHRHSVLEAAALLLRGLWRRPKDVEVPASEPAGPRADRATQRANCSAAVAALLPTLRRVGRGEDRRAGLATSSGGGAKDGRGAGKRRVRRSARKGAASVPSPGTRRVCSTLFGRLMHVMDEYAGVADASGDEASPGPASLGDASVCRAVSLMRDRSGFRWPAVPRCQAEQHPAWAGSEARAVAYAALNAGPECDGAAGRELAGLESTVLSLRCRPSPARAAVIVSRLAELAGSAEVTALPEAARPLAMACWLASGFAARARGASDAGAAGGGRVTEGHGWSSCSVDPSRVAGGEAHWAEDDSAAPLHGRAVGAAGGEPPLGAEEVDGLPPAVGAEAPPSPGVAAAVRACLQWGCLRAGAGTAAAEAALQAVLGGEEVCSSGSADQAAVSMLHVAHACAAIANSLESLAVMAQAAGETAVPGTGTVGEVCAALSLVSPEGTASLLERGAVAV
ncbi:unnamed protein product [Symbiodinium sp. KB8]|nr:unnamed protein product [Symbiodinium sp. KB8]